MPLDYDNVPWPPAECHRPIELYREWDAWYSGDPERLTRVYANLVVPNNHPSQYRGGVVGTLARFWWGRPIPSGQPAAKLHIPVPSDIASLSADLLFSRPPDIDLSEPTVVDGRRVPDPVQATFETIAEDGALWSRLQEGAEQCSALGGIYLRCAVLPGVVEVPFVEAIPPECAVPEWRAGWLVAVTFWREVSRDGKAVWRHLERHEPGYVFHGLYRGTEDKLGTLVDPRSMPATANLIEYAADGTAMVAADGTLVFETGATGLAAAYVPNMRPNRKIKGASLGRSDYDTSEQVFDALDETWSSLMRDIRLAKGRVVVPDHFLRSAGPGQGASFDPEQEIFTTVRAMPGADQGGALSQVQFQIRVTEHLDTARALTRKALETAGYDAGSLDEGDGATKTATEVANDSSRTVNTRGRKITYWTPALKWLARTLLEMSAHTFGTPLPAQNAGIEWPSIVSVDPEKLARSVQLLDAAEAISTRTKVQMVHPDWKDSEIDEEVALIGASAPAPVNAPDQFGA